MNNIISYRNNYILLFQCTAKQKNMNRRLLYVLIITVAMVISVTCQPDAMLAPPGRPSEFRTPDQLRSYLKALNDYYAIVGRPRYVCCFSCFLHQIISVCCYHAVRFQASVHFATRYHRFFFRRV